MEKIKSIYRKYLHNFIGVSALFAFTLNLIIETLARQSLLGGLRFFFEHPIVFLYNTLLIFAWLSIAMLFRHKAFVFTILATTCLVLGIVNGLILRNRMTPFTTYDLLEFKDGLSLATNYLSKGSIIMLIVGAVVLVVAIIVLWKKAPKSKEKVNYKRAIATLLLIGLIVTGSTSLVVKTGTVDTYFPNLAYGYRDNGFTYCFLATWLDKGVSKPKNYSEEKMKNIFSKKELETTVPGREGKTDKKAPNIIYLQLESFIDPNTVKDITLSKDAIPNFRRLMKEYSSGKLQVPAMGAGTANTEFETMTGMSVKFFGPGEYPYKSVLLEKSVESIPYNLRQVGYSTHAIHNHRGAFYGRNEVLGNLGFETFTSIEYMNNVSKTPKNWSRDYVLTGAIMDALRSSQGKDYIYSISVQGHGRYPTEEILIDPEIQVTKAPSEELTWAWEYYVNQIHEMDDYINQLIATLKTYDEDVILVMYGDHLPALDNLTEENLAEGRNIYQTNYVIWSNFKMKKQDKDLHAYEIGSEVLDRIDIHNGTLVTYHQNHRDSKNYLKNLEAIQYDLLYGKQYLYGGKSPFKPIDLKMGVNKIKITEVIKTADKYFIKGQNFTENSKVNLNGKILDTEYIGPTILEVKEKVTPDDISKMKISQVEGDKEILSTSE